ncbi:MAG: succinate dehydrogenase, cytochrome b556 subunit [Gammaproteobacteria bacterium]|nr:succinate dehydrogenase, cytochrome b556 subunit [Gammaproteobacteria bacterium]
MSPHISIYRWPITMTVSILHRMTGVAMSVGLVVLAWWLGSLSLGGDQYDTFVGLMSSLPGRLLLLGWSFAFFLHLANGIRHLAWDLGHGFERQQADASAWLVLLLAVVCTAVFWYLL